MRAHTIIAALAFIALPVLAKAGTTYSFTTIDAPYPTGAAPQTTFLLGINNNGAIVGYSVEQVTSLSGYLHGFVYQNGNFNELTAPKVGSLDPSPPDFTVQGTIASGINDSGKIVGQYYVGGTSQLFGPASSFTYKSGTFSDYSIPGQPPFWTLANAINNAGNIAGSIMVNGSPSNIVGFVDKNDAVTQPVAGNPPPGGVGPSDEYLSGLTAINNNGLALGSTTWFPNAPGPSYMRGFYYDTNGDAFTTLNDPLPSTCFSFPPVPGDHGHPCTVTDVTTTTGINDLGQIVGYTQSLDLGQQAFVYDNGVYTPFTWSQAFDMTPTAINNEGDIIGFYNDLSDGWVHGFEAVPVTTSDLPEPASLALLTIGLLGLRQAKRRRPSPAGVIA